MIRNQEGWDSQVYVINCDNDVLLEWIGIRIKGMEP